MPKHFPRKKSKLLAKDGLKSASLRTQINAFTEFYGHKPHRMKDLAIFADEHPEPRPAPWPPIKPGHIAMLVAPSDRELQIDLDRGAAYLFFQNRLRFFRSQLRAYRKLRDWKIEVKITQSKTSGHRHATITLSQRMTIAERGWAAALLGDDLNRGMYNFFRYLNESRFPIIFYEKRKKRHGQSSKKQ